MAWDDRGTAVAQLDRTTGVTVGDISFDYGFSKGTCLFVMQLGHQF